MKEKEYSKCKHLQQFHIFNYKIKHLQTFTHSLTFIYTQHTNTQKKEDKYCKCVNEQISYERTYVAILSE